MENAWTIVILGFASTVLAPALLLWMKHGFDRSEREAAERRADEREARTQAALETIKKQTDGVIAQVTALAKATGRIEGGVEATKAAEGTAATLALGQQQGRDAERESISTKLAQEGATPLPVVDKITNETGERAAKALENMATTAKEVANAKTEGKKE